MIHAYCFDGGIRRVSNEIAGFSVASRRTLHNFLAVCEAILRIFLFPKIPEKAKSQAILGVAWDAAANSRSANSNFGRVATIGQGN
jgi:hypothetical protein